MSWQNPGAWKRATLFCVLFLVPELLLTSQTQPRSQGQSPSLRDRFNQEASSRWEEYARRAKLLQGVRSFRVSGTYQDMKVHNSYELKRNASCKLLRMVAERTRGGKEDYHDIEVFAENPNYSFSLRRKTDTSPWVVSRLIDRKNSESSSPFQKDFDEFERGNCDLIRVARCLLVELVQKPEFRVVRCQPSQRARDELVEIVFDYPHKVEKGGNDIQGGTLLLDPAQFWCLRSYDVRLKSEVEGYRGTEKYEVVEFGESNHNLPIPKRAICERKFIFADGKSNEQVWEHESNLSVPRPLPGDEEFTLSAFGLPEPPGLAWKRPMRWYLWVGLAGIVCLVSGVGFRWLRRRKAGNA